MRPIRKMARTLILSLYRSLPYPVRVSAIFERRFEVIWGPKRSKNCIGRKWLLEPLQGTASTTRGCNSLFPARGLKLLKYNHESFVYYLEKLQFTFPREGIETLATSESGTSRKLTLQFTFPREGIETRTQQPELHPPPNQSLQFTFPREGIETLNFFLVEQRKRA